MLETTNDRCCDCLLGREFLQIRNDWGLLYLRDKKINKTLLMGCTHYNDESKTRNVCKSKFTFQQHLVHLAINLLDLR